MAEAKFYSKEKIDELLAQAGGGLPTIEIGLGQFSDLDHFTLTEEQLEILSQNEQIVVITEVSTLPGYESYAKYNGVYVRALVDEEYTLSRLLVREDGNLDTGYISVSEDGSSTYSFREFSGGGGGSVAGGGLNTFVMTLHHDDGDTKFAITSNKDEKAYTDMFSAFMEQPISSLSDAETMFNMAIGAGMIDLDILCNGLAILFGGSVAISDDAPVQTEPRVLFTKADITAWCRIATLNTSQHKVYYYWGFIEDAGYYKVDSINASDIEMPNSISLSIEPAIGGGGGGTTYEEVSALPEEGQEGIVYLLPDEGGQGGGGGRGWEKVTVHLDGSNTRFMQDGDGWTVDFTDTQSLYEKLNKCNIVNIKYKISSETTINSSSVELIYGPWLTGLATMAKFGEDTAGFFTTVMGVQGTGISLYVLGSKIDNVRSLIEGTGLDIDFYFNYPDSTGGSGSGGGSTGYPDYYTLTVASDNLSLSCVQIEKNYVDEFQLEIIERVELMLDMTGLTFETAISIVEQMWPAMNKETKLGLITSLGSFIEYCGCKVKWAYNQFFNQAGTGVNFLHVPVPGKAHPVVIMTGNLVIWDDDVDFDITSVGINGVAQPFKLTAELADSSAISVTITKQS